MRKIILELTASLDGFIEGPNQEIDWIKADTAADAYLKQFASEIDTVLLGRVSYEMSLKYGGTDNSMKSLVFSDTMQPVEGLEIVRSNQLIQTVAKLKLTPGKNIWLWGGASLITSFVNADLIDEYRIAVQPVILGSGKPLFKDISRMVDLKLLKATTWPSGIVQMIYERA